MFRIVSDLHLEGIKQYFLPETENEKDTVLILAGDICEFPLLDRHDCFKHFLEDCDVRFKKIVYVPGNHEYFGTFLKSFPFWKELIEKKYENITVMDRETITVTMGDKNFKIVGATLWTDMNNGDPMTTMEAQSFLADDFKRIDKLTPKQVLDHNDLAREYIIDSLMDSLDTYDPTIVVTHHGPTEMSIASKYKMAPMTQNHLFVNTNMESYFDHVPLRLWVHGHTHETIDHTIGHGCRVIANPKGYSMDLMYDGVHYSSPQNKSYDDTLVLSPDDLYF